MLKGILPIVLCNCFRLKLECKCSECSLEKNVKNIQMYIQLRFSNKHKKCSFAKSPLPEDKETVTEMNCKKSDLLFFPFTAIRQTC